METPQQILFHLSPDKSPKQERFEMLGRKPNLCWLPSSKKRKSFYEELKPLCQFIANQLKYVLARMLKRLNGGSSLIVVSLRRSRNKPGLLSSPPFQTAPERRCRGPNTMVSLRCFDKKGIGLCSWNSAHQKPSIKKQKVQEFCFMVQGSDVLVIQESRGLKDLFDQILKLALKTQSLFLQFLLQS